MSVKGINILFTKSPAIKTEQVYKHYRKSEGKINTVYIDQKRSVCSIPIYKIIYSGFTFNFPPQYHIYLFVKTSHHSQIPRHDSSLFCFVKDERF